MVIVVLVRAIVGVVTGEVRSSRIKVVVTVCLGPLAAQRTGADLRDLIERDRLQQESKSNSEYLWEKGKVYVGCEAIS